MGSARTVRGKSDLNPSTGWCLNLLGLRGAPAGVILVRQIAHGRKAEEECSGHHDKKHHAAKGKDPGLRHGQSRFGNAWTRNNPKARIEGTHMPTKMPFNLSSTALSLAK